MLMDEWDKIRTRGSSGSSLGWGTRITSPFLVAATLRVESMFVAATAGDFTSSEDAVSDIAIWRL